MQLDLDFCITDQCNKSKNRHTKEFDQKGLLHTLQLCILALVYSVSVIRLLSYSVKFKSVIASAAKRVSQSYYATYYVKFPCRTFTPISVSVVWVVLRLTGFLWLRRIKITKTRVSFESIRQYALACSKSLLQFRSIRKPSLHYSLPIQFR